MITEDYVSFETTKLLKEKGFMENCLMRYNKVGDLVKEAHKFNWNFQTIDYSAPTLQMAMKWLREVHKLYVNVCPSVEGYYWTEKWNSYAENLEEEYPFGRFIGTFNSHEEACEAGIKYCLEHLIK